VLIVQGALTVWVLALVLRAAGFGDKPLALLGVTAGLSGLTTLPWLASILLTDIFAGLAVLALYLLVFADGVLQRWERNALLALLSFSVATHSATFAVIMALVAAAALAWWWFRLGAGSGIVRSGVALAMGAMMLVGANYVVARQMSWTPGGLALSFGRMLQDGIVNRYLNDHCREERLKLCAYRHQLPTDADVFFWSGNGSIFNTLGRFSGLGDEMEKIVLGSLRDYPMLQAETAVTAALHQLTRISTGEGVVNSIWHTYSVIDAHVPAATADMHAARQQRGEISPAMISRLNRIHRPVAFASMLLLLAAIMLEWRRGNFTALTPLAGTVTAALLANAFVCGVLSNPHDRYGARLIWLAPLVVALMLCRLYARHGMATDTRIAAPLATKSVPPA
jgi:hypothetical protein